MLNEIYKYHVKSLQRRLQACRHLPPWRYLLAVPCVSATTPPEEQPLLNDWPSEKNEWYMGFVVLETEISTQQKSRETLEYWPIGGH